MGDLTAGSPGSGGGRRPRAGDGSRPTLLVNPPTDLGLRGRLDAALDERSPATPAELEDILRPDYPRLVVRARALEHESVIVWYVYREGYWVPATVEPAPADEAAADEAPVAATPAGEEEP